jgi:hypothetical protein
MNKLAERDEKWLRQERRREIAWRRLQSAAQAGAYIRSELVRASAELHHDYDDNDRTMQHVINALQESVALHKRLESAASWLGYSASTLLDHSPWRGFVGLKHRRK